MRGGRPQEQMRPAWARRGRGLTALVGTLSVFALISPAGAGAQSAYLVGASSRSINPNADGTFAGQPVYLGGYGIGGGSPIFKGRAASGILDDGIHVRAF